MHLLYMLNIRKICWGMLSVMAIGYFEPAARADVPDIKSVIRGTRVVAEPSLANVLSGNSLPTAIKFKDLTPDWRVMSTNGQFEFGNFQAFVGIFGGGFFATSYYTKGQTVSIGSETYIVAYSLLSLADQVAPETLLNLSLLNLKTIGSMSNIRTFDSIAETKVLERQLASLQFANIFDPTKTGKPTEKPEQPTAKPVEEPEKVQPKPTVRKKRIRSNRQYRRRSLRRSTRSNINRK